jgi:hypothetical protein
MDGARSFISTISENAAKAVPFQNIGNTWFFRSL